MASEVISLLHGLLASSASETAKIWASAVRDVLCEALDYVPDLMRTLEAEGRVLIVRDKAAAEEQEPEEDGQLSNEHDWFFKARNVMASLCALGGFRQSVHSGCTVQVKCFKAMGDIFEPFVCNIQNGVKSTQSPETLNKNFVR